MIGHKSLVVAYDLGLPPGQSSSLPSSLVKQSTLSYSLYPLWLSSSQRKLFQLIMDRPIHPSEQDKEKEGLGKKYSMTPKHLLFNKLWHLYAPHLIAT
jgi:hypothetical protein